MNDNFAVAEMEKMFKEAYSPNQKRGRYIRKRALPWNMDFDVNSMYPTRMMISAGRQSGKSMFTQQAIGRTLRKLANEVHKP